MRCGHSQLLAMLIVAAIGLFVGGGCRRGIAPGILHVGAASEGTYEIYRVAGDEPLQFIAEQVGRYNVDVVVEPGKYLVLADCSSETVYVHSGSAQRLRAHVIEFIPPQPPEPNDKFSIQCHRYGETRSRQNILNRYSITALEQDLDLLVGMIPFRIAAKELTSSEGTLGRKVVLAGIRVSAEGHPDVLSPFFISPANDVLAVAEPQTFGHWFYVLPEHYFIELNGTKMSVQLSEGQLASIAPSLLKVSTTSVTDMGRSAEVLGTPFFVEVNDGRWLNFNEVYPLLPGEVSLSLNGSSHKTTVNMQSGQFVSLEARTVLVDLGCSPWEWACLGRKKVMLYMDGATYPFVTGVTDVPILFLESAVQVSIEGSQDIRVRVPDENRDTEFKAGFVQLVPQIMVRSSGHATDLVRVEPTVPSMLGHSIDVPLEYPFTMALLAGSYDLAQFTSAASPDAERRAVRRRFTVRPGKTTEQPFAVQLTDKAHRLAHIAAKNAEAEESHPPAAPTRHIATPITIF